jgi:cleavage and polyadenylation specificity factor subunit 3
MFLEAQFGADNVNPIAVPKLDGQEAIVRSSPTVKDEGADDGASESSEDEERELEALQRQEIDRLHNIGIPVPGVEIKVDKNVAKVWLEDLEIECANRMFAERVRVVVERAVEVTAPLWA